MEENYGKISGEAKLKSPLLTKLENFWYHYKWHSVVAAFLVVVITISSLQMCSKADYDSYILYAGNYEIKKTNEGGANHYLDMLSSLKRIGEDFDNDGNVNISLLNLYVLNAEEIEEAEKNLEDGESINESLIMEDTSTLSTTLLYGEHYVCFLSERIFLENEAKYEGLLFAPIRSYASDSGEYEYASEHGVYLRSLDIYSLPEICELPDDTVVCIRRLSEVSSVFGKKDNEEYFRRAEILIRNILGYSAD